MNLLSRAIFTDTRVPSRHTLRSNKRLILIPWRGKDSPKQVENICSPENHCRTNRQPSNNHLLNQLLTKLTPRLRKLNEPNLFRIPNVRLILCNRISVAISTYEIPTLPATRAIPINRHRLLARPSDRVGKVSVLRLQSLHCLELDRFAADLALGVDADWVDVACCKVLLFWAFEEVQGRLHCFGVPDVEGFVFWVALFGDEALELFPGKVDLQYEWSIGVLWF